jgi:sugar lactone lactonase YvrE
VAGDGVAGFNADNVQATSSELNYPIDVAPLGRSFYIADEVNYRIRFVNPQGIITTVAGNGNQCAGHIPNTAGDPCGDRGPATSAEFAQPTSVAPLKGGGFLVADRADNTVRKINKRGIISTVAGTGENCEPLVAFVPCGDGGRATAAKLDNPDRAIPTPDGGFLITEDHGNRIRKVSKRGIIKTVAGVADGTPCGDPTTACGDGGPARRANLNAPNGVAVFNNGSFVFTDSLDQKVRLVKANGKIVTIAGDGNPGSFGDGIAARLANLNNPSDVAIAPDNSIIVADTYSHIIRRLVSHRGRYIITTIAGEPDATANPCAPADVSTTCDLNTPYGVGVDKNGRVFIADHLNLVIRKLSTRFRARG